MKKEDVKVFRESKYEVPKFSESILNYCKENKIQICRNRLDVIKFEKCSITNPNRQYVFHISDKGELTFNILEYKKNYGKVNVWIKEDELELILQIVKELKIWVNTKFFCDCLHNKIKKSNSTIATKKRT